MKYKKPPSLEELRQVLDYNPQNGLFYHKRNSGRGKIGAIAGFINGDGYRSVSVLGKSFLGHRLAWYYYSGEYPDEIDHRNGIRSDNSILNLRSGNRAQNNLNSAGWNKDKRKNKLPRGVYKYKACERKFRAQIVVNRKIIHLGCYDTVEQAANAYKAAAEKHFGEYAFHKR